MGVDYMIDYETRLSEINHRLRAIANEAENENITAERITALGAEVDQLTAEKRDCETRLSEIFTNTEKRSAILRGLARGDLGETIERGQSDMRSDNKMDNTNNEIRSLQKFILDGGTRNMSDTEIRALNLTGSAAILPVEIFDKMITGTKYSDLLTRATVMQQPNVGTLKIPVASATDAVWKIENSTVDGSSTTYEATPTLTALDLKAYELYRWSRVSAATLANGVGTFSDVLAELLAAEVVEALEYAFVNGSGSDEPKGLASLTWTPDTNQILTASAATPIGPDDIAEALSLLPQKYARNAVVICNADMLYQIGKFKGTSEYAFSLADGATRFLGKPIIVSEHVADDTIYIVDPTQLYVNFTQPIQVEADRSSGFTAASIDLRALAVVGAVWNPAACVAVGLGAGGE